MARYPSASKIPATPLKTLCASLMLAGVTLGGPAVAHADETCTVPCIFSDGQTHTLVDGSALSLMGVAGINMVSISGDGTSLVGNNLTLNLGDTSVAHTWNSGINLSSGGTLSLTGGTFTLGEHARGVDVEDGTAMLDNINFTSAPTARVEDVYLGGNNSSVTVSNSQFTVGGDTGAAVWDIGNGNTIHLQNDTFNFSGYDQTSAVTVWDSSGTLSIDNSTFHVDEASSSDTAVLSEESTQIRNSTFDGVGGGIWLEGTGTSTITGSTIDTASGDVTVSGSGIQQLSVDNSQLQATTGDNVSVSDAAATVSISNTTMTTGSGTGINEAGGNVNLANSSVTTNGGQGIFAQVGTIALTGSTVNANGTAGTAAVELSKAATLSADNSTIAAQSGPAFTIYGPGNTLDLSNGTTITGGNGVSVSVNYSNREAGGYANVLANGNVTMNGAIDVNANNSRGYVSADVALRNNSTLNGDAIFNGAGGTLSLDDSQMNGHISQTSARSLNTITLSDNSTLNDPTQNDAIDALNGMSVSIDNSAINAQSGYALNVAPGSTTTFTNSSASSSNSNGTIYMNGVTVPLDGDTITNTGAGTAVYMSDPTQALTIDNSHLITNTGYALDIEPGSNVTFTDSSASSANSNGTIYMNGAVIPLEDATITNTGAGTAIYMSDPTQALTINHSNLITNTGHALDIEAGSNVTFTNSTATSANSIGTVYMNGATIPLNGDTLTNTGSGAALYADGTGGDVALTDSHLINSGNGAGLYVGGDADVTLTRSTITAQNGDAIDLGNGNNSVTLDDSDVSGGTLTANGTQNQITLQNDAQLNMNVLSSAGTTDLTATAGSTFTGAAQALDAVTLDPSSHWDMTGDSTLDTLNLNGGTVHFTPASGYATLTANTLNGGGQIAMQTNLADGQGDKLVTNGGSGAYALQIDDHSTHAPSLTNTYYQVVQTQATGPTFSLVGGETDVGAYQYKLTQQNSGWYLFNTTQRTNTVNATLAAQQAASNIWFDELQPLYARMGDLRLTPNNDGVWVRTYGSKERLSPSGADGVDTTLYMTEVGVDHGIHLGSGSWYVGATLGSGNVLESFAGGAGSATATPITAGLYATWASNQGWYGDFVLKYDSLSQHYDTSGSGVPISANSHVNGVTASAEGGMRFQLPHQWFVEPQVELAALYQGGSNYVTSYGTQVSGSGGTATTGRVSVMVGHPAQVQLFPSKPALDLEPYANFSLIRQFSGSSNETVDGAYFSSNVRETRGQIALGVSMQPVHKWQGFVELAYGKGQHYEQPWGFDVGVKKIW